MKRLRLFLVERADSVTVHVDDDAPDGFVVELVVSSGRPLLLSPGDAFRVVFPVPVPCPAPRRWWRRA